MQRFFAGGVQEATRTDSNGDTFYEALPNEWSDIYLQAIRSPNGSDIYGIANTSDADVRLVLDTLIPAKGCLSDVTWPPQLDPSTDIAAFTSARTQRLVYGNEPPLHIPSVWADGAAYASGAQTWYNALSAENKAKAWFQTGKPEVIRYSLVGASGLAKHNDCLDELSPLVLNGTLPARIATTHKLSPDYPEADKYALYKQLLRDYQGYFGNNVKILFHEYKLADAEMDSLSQLQVVMEFWCAMARLQFEEGESIAGGSFQQLAGAGTANIFGLDKPPAQGGVWTVNELYNMWNLAQDMRNRAYIYTEQIDKPDTLQIEVFGDDERQFAYFANLGSAVSFAVPGGQKIEYWDSDMRMKTGDWTGSVPANSVGRISRYVVRRQPNRWFSFIRNL